MKTAIVGLGKTGWSCAKFLRNKQMDFIVIDSRISPPFLSELQQLSPNTELRLGGFDETTFQDCAQLIVSPGVDLNQLKQVPDNCETIGDIELFARYANAPVIAITGTNGKSTVTSLVAHIAQANHYNVAVGGNLGTPVLDLLADDVELYVLEVSSFQLELTNNLSAAAAVILNLSEDHLDRHASLDAYLKAKQRIYLNAGTIVASKDEPQFSKHVDILYGLEQPGPSEFGTQDGWLCFSDHRLLELKQLQLVGEHNYSNCLAAMALAYAVGIAPEDMVKPLQSFNGLAHRCQFVGEIAGAFWCNDSKATNVGAAITALKSMSQRYSGKIIWIAGGDGKQADFSPLGPIVRKHVKLAILLGKDAKALASTLSSEVRHHIVPNLSEAVSLAYQNLSAGDCVLLAPACSSLDMFTDFAERGQQFMQLAKELH